jgi:alpha-beta hydrolase superfamily lysophospholipase
MVDVTNEALDLAVGLGAATTVIGMSLGGVLAGWAAQHRADVAQAVLLAPALGLQALPPRRSQLIANLLALMPNRFQWWSPTRKAERAGPLHAYPRFSTRGVAAFLQVACLVRNAAQQYKPAARTILLITNPCDNVVDNATALAVVQHWRSHGAAVDCREFPAEWQLIHDVLDAAQPGQQIERAYPLLLEWITTPLLHPARAI